MTLQNLTYDEISNYKGTIREPCPTVRWVMEQYTNPRNPQFLAGWTNSDDPRRIAQIKTVLRERGYVMPLIQKGKLKISRYQHNGNGTGARGADALEEIGKWVKLIVGDGSGVEINKNKLRITLTPGAQKNYKKLTKNR